MNLVKSEAYHTSQTGCRGQSRAGATPCPPDTRSPRLGPSTLRVLSQTLGWGRIGQCKRADNPGNVVQVDRQKLEGTQS